VEELAYSLLARAGAGQREKTPVLFMECNQSELDQFAGELEAQLPVEVERVLLDDLPARLAGEGEPPWRVAVTTFFHVHEVQELAEPRGIETVALLAEATIESLQKLTELPPRTPVGVVGSSQTCVDNLSRSLEGAGLDHLDFVEVHVEEDPGELRDLLRRVRAVVCSSSTARKLRELEALEGADHREPTVFGRPAARRLGELGEPADGRPGGVEIIEEDRTLDKGGVEMLGRLLRRVNAPIKPDDGSPGAGTDEGR
jgi:hypothetical protein